MRVYPFGVGGGGPPGNVVNRWSAQSQLLPYLEQGALFNSLNFVGLPWLNLNPVYGPMNQTALTTTIAGFVCPSDFDRIIDPLNTAHNSYRACAGTLPYNLKFDSPDQTGQDNGGFWFQSAVSPSRITDGLSMTAFFCERCLGDSVSPDPLSDYYLTGDMISDCSAAGPSQIASANRPQRMVRRTLGRRECPLHALSAHFSAWLSELFARRVSRLRQPGCRDRDKPTPRRCEPHSRRRLVSVHQAVDQLDHLDGPRNGCGGRSHRCRLVLTMNCGSGARICSSR